MDNILSLEKLAFERNYQFLFQNINCSLAAGDTLQIMGSNGSGKSTLLRILAGFLDPSEGTLFWKNKPIQDLRTSYQNQLHYVGHQNGIKPLLSVLENLQLSCLVSQNQTAPKIVSNIIEKMGLTEQRYTFAINLSAGQLRRVCLARLLLNPMPIWILDEPTTSLDASGSQLLINMLEEHLQTGGICILATHLNLALKSKIKILQLGVKAQC